MVQACSHEFQKGGSWDPWRVGVGGLTQSVKFREYTAFESLRMALVITLYHKYVQMSAVTSHFPYIVEWV